MGYIKTTKGSTTIFHAVHEALDILELHIASLIFHRLKIWFIKLACDILPIGKICINITLEITFKNYNHLYII